MKTKLTYWILLIICLGFDLTSPFSLFASESGYKYYKNFTPGEYDHFAQNWQIAQDKNGIIYVANQAGLLEYDGENWQIIKDVGYDPVRSMAIDNEGTIYLGGINSIGYLRKTDNGVFKYISLVEYIDREYREFSYVWKTIALNDCIYFRTDYYLFQWDKKKISIWPIDTRIRNIFDCRGKLYIHIEKMGLATLEEGKITPVKGGDLFANNRVRLIVPFDERRILLYADKLGFFIYDGTSFVTHGVEDKINEYINSYGISSGIKLSSGDYALATSSGGMIVMENGGNQKYIFNKKSGLQNNKVRHIKEDQFGNLWLALNKGISRLEYNSPFSQYNDLSGLPDIISTVIQNQGILYCGTFQGLYMKDPVENRFKPVTGIHGRCESLCSYGSDLIVASSNGLFVVNKSGKIKETINNEKSYEVLASNRFPGSIWCSTRVGLLFLSRLDNRWIAQNKFFARRKIASMTEDQNGILWVLLQSGQIFSLDPKIDMAQPVIVEYRLPSENSEPGLFRITQATGHVVFLTNTGLYRADEKNSILIPDNLLGKEYTGGLEGKPVFRLVENMDRRIWFQSQSRIYRATPGKKGIYKISDHPFRRIPTTAQVNKIYPDPGKGMVWFASNDGLLYFDEMHKKDINTKIKVFIRNIEINRDLFFKGSGYTQNNIVQIFDYKNRNLKFQFAAPFFQVENKIQYRYFLEGYDNKWAPWSKNSQYNYTNLPHGNYRFRVQARNIYGTISDEDSFEFQVLPPWTRTWWAYLLYVTLFFFLMYIGIKWKTRISELEKKKLEITVKERTKEIANKNIELEQKTILLKEKSENINVKNQQLEKQTLKLTEQSEKLKEMDKMKSRFFANISHEFRTPLTLIMGPLEQLIKNPKYLDLKGKIGIMLRNSRRLARLINQLLDLSKLDSSKMKLQASEQDIISFTKGIAASFEWMVMQKKQTMRLDFSREEIITVFDSEKMEKILANLLVNAVKFTPKGGAITISVNKQPEQVEISIKDTGIGISVDHLPHIFDRFFQENQSNNHDNNQTGTGIGLALTRELITLHHGRIDVHSTKGEGTEFIIHLPLGKKHLAPDEIIPYTGDNKNKPLQNISQYLEVESETPGTLQAKPSTQTKESEEDKNDVVLIIDDNADMRHYIRESLELYYRVEEAVDGDEGIRKAKELIPTLIITDIMMPGIDGYQVCRTLKKDIATSHVPIIMLTAKASEDSLIHGLDTGTDDYITKPFSTQALLSRVKNLIELRHQLQELYRRKMFLSDKRSISTIDDQFMEKYRTIIKDGFQDSEFTIDVLCEKIEMGRSTLFKKIKALTGETPNHHILSARLESSALLLKDKSRSVTDVAFDVGFSSSAYFAKCFKDRFNLSPSDYQSANTE